MKTRPIPIRMPKSIRCDDINIVQSHREDRIMHGKGGGQVIPYTCISVYFRTGSPVVLMKLRDDREDMYRLAKEISNLIIKHRLEHAR